MNRFFTSWKFIPFLLSLICSVEMNILALYVTGNENEIILQQPFNTIFKPRIIPLKAYKENEEILSVHLSIISYSMLNGVKQPVIFHGVVESSPVVI